MNRLTTFRTVPCHFVRQYHPGTNNKHWLPYGMSKWPPPRPKRNGLVMVIGGGLGGLITADYAMDHFDDVGPAFILASLGVAVGAAIPLIPILYAPFYLYKHKKVE